MTNEGEVVLWKSNDGDNQLWYWDGRNGDILRNKQFPNMVLDFDHSEYEDEDWGRVTLNEDCHNGWNQRWRIRDGEIFCKGSEDNTIEDLCLDVNGAKTHNGAKIGVYQRNGQDNQKWRLEDDELKYFFICEKQCGKNLDAAMDGSDEGEVVLWEHNGQDNQLWFVDAEGILRNKEFPEKVLDFHCDDYHEDGWGKVYLSEDLHHGYNQQWHFHSQEIVCKGFQDEEEENLRLD